MSGGGMGRDQIRDQNRGGTIEDDWDGPNGARRRSPGRFPGGRRPVQTGLGSV